MKTLRLIALIAAGRAFVEGAVLLEERAQQVGAVAVIAGDELLAQGQRLEDRLGDHRLEQVLFAAEVQIGEALADPGSARDVLELGGRKATLDEQLQRCLHYLA